MADNFHFFYDKIEQCLLPLDVNYFVEDLKHIFNNTSLNLIRDSELSRKVHVFLEQFQQIDGVVKYEQLRKSAEKHNNWIYSFLSVDRTNVTDLNNLIGNWIVLKNVLDLLSKSRNTLCVMNECIIRKLFSKEVITKASRDHLLKCLENYGAETTLFNFFNVISSRKTNWYGSVLYIFASEQTAFMDIICDEMNVENSGLTNENYFHEYANTFIEKHVRQYHTENIITVTNPEEILNDGDNEGDTSDYSSTVGSNYEEDIDLEQELDDSDVIRVELKLKKFQLELSELALQGKNVIIYAPTGTGKTVVAVHIANQHLLNNREGKVAFLVPRTPLVTQQYNIFEKFKEPNLKVMEIRGKTDCTSGPLIANMKYYDVFVMTSDILKNALTLDDGNKLSSICEFSLIFFDECHNCMKLHPYTKIMKEYFKVKKENPRAKLPQIVGLTASPRSNKKDDIVGMQKSLYELCANMDCINFSMVKENLAELEEEMTLPKQEVLKSKQRTQDEFEVNLINVMSKCEIKLLQMRDEKYFPKTAIKTIPDNKFEEEYVGFVGCLEKLNTFTIDENDGKQKAYSIYRYLNAYYRGLIVNQMFDEFYARKTISKYLKHNGVDFTCCYDEEFYNSYKNDVLEMAQSDNPSIETIKTLIQKQLTSKTDSRILIFVRQVDYTYYMVDVLKKVDNINAEAIVGSNTKNNLKGCTINEMNQILTRFNNGDTKVLIATTVVEEGLDVGLCNMVISYGHVTNETALIQRRGRARSTDSRYILVLPPMLTWLEKKELLNERRKEMMMKLIKFGEINCESSQMNLFIMDYQQRNFFVERKTTAVVSESKTSWNFKCKKCQLLVCSSEDIRIVEGMHRVCINPTLLTTFTVSRRELQSFGTQGIYEIGGVVICNCHNNELGNFMLYRKIPYFQISITACNIEAPANLSQKVHSLKKWKDFTKFYEIKDLSRDELQQYCEKVNELDI